MTKGLQRSKSRAPAISKDTVKQRIAVSSTVTVSATGSAVGFGTVVISDFPQGNILLLGCVAALTTSGSGSDANLTDTWEGDISVGTTPVNDATISGTDADILPSTALAAATSEVGVLTRITNATPIIFDNTDGSLELNLNVLVDAAHITNDESVNLTVTGELNVLFSVLGDD